MESQKSKVKSQNYNSKPKSFNFLILVLPFYFLVFTFMGCATYKFQRGQAPQDKGYVVLRDDYAIPEYTIGKDNSVPAITLAKKRFTRRKRIVEHYYKKTGEIENRFKMAFWDPLIVFFKTAGGLFRLPFIALSDYRYEHNPKYRERIRSLEDEKEAREEARIKKLHDELNAYIQKDLLKYDSTD